MTRSKSRQLAARAAASTDANQTDVDPLTPAAETPTADADDVTAIDPNEPTPGDGTAPGPSNTANAPRRQPKRRQKPKKKKNVKFHEPTQRTVRRDNIDQQCRQLNIRYRRWPGNTQPKNFLHKSHCDFLDDNDYFPVEQRVPGDCILCPLQKYLKDNWDKRRHYRSKHQVKLLVLDNVIMLHCKCSAVRSRGWDRDKSARNAHYHCPICHWPRDKRDQLMNHIRTIHGRAEDSLRHLLAKKK